jgi:L-lactate dehydrogenase
MKKTSIGIIGLGWVGASTALSIIHKGICKELLLNDIKTGLAEGEAMDLNHGSSFYPSCKIRASEISDMEHCDAIVITAGRGSKPGETRLDLLNENVKIAKQISSELKGFQGILIIVANPVDILTYYYQKFTQLPANRVIGTGTMLETARLREIIGRKLEIDPRNIHAQVIGEHGDSNVTLWSSATIGSMKLRNWDSWNTNFEPEIESQVRNAAYEIIKRKGATNHAIGLVTATLLKWILKGNRRIVNVSSLINNNYGLSDVALSLPSLIDENGISKILDLELTNKEMELLEKSSKILKEAMSSIKY